MKCPMMIKTAWSARTFKKLPKIIFYKGSKTPENMYKAMKNQKQLKAMSKLYPKRVWDEHVTPALRHLSGHAVGTVSGKRVHINKDLVDKMKREGRKLNLREVVNHEKFHTLPVIGPSETLAHIYGGAFSKKKDTIFGRIRGGARGYRHLWKTRPLRAPLELAAAGGSVVGGKAIVDKVNKNDEDEKK